MNFIRLLPVILSFLLLGAHFLRAGLVPLTALCVALPLLLLLRKTWVPLLFQLLLLLAAIEWLRTIYAVAQVRIAMGDSWMRMAIILGVVALFTALSGLVFRNRKLADRYKAP